MTTYDPTSTMRQARTHYFKVNGFGDEGNYDDAWVDFHLGLLPCPFPNTQGRIRAVKVHDLHHILTGYHTDFTGELEIAGWELGAGCRGFAAAWVLNLAALAAGVVVAPRRVLAAFVRGRRAQSLYGRDLDALLDTTVAALRGETCVDRPAARASAGDVLGFAGYALVGALVALVMAALAPLVVPVGLLSGLLRRAAAARTA